MRVRGRKERDRTGKTIHSEPGAAKEVPRGRPSIRNQSARRSLGPWLLALGVWGLRGDERWCGTEDLSSFRFASWLCWFGLGCELSHFVDHPSPTTFASPGYVTLSIGQDSNAVGDPWASHVASFWSYYLLSLSLCQSIRSAPPPSPTQPKTKTLRGDQQGKDYQGKKEGLGVMVTKPREHFNSSLLLSSHREVRN